MFIKAAFLQEKTLQRLFSHRAITQFAQSFISGFGVMFIYQVSGESLQTVLLAYIGIIVVSSVLLPFSSIAFNKVGTKNSLLLGIIFRMGMWLSLLATTPVTWMYTLPIYVFCNANVRFWYWPTFNTTLTINTESNTRTQALSFLKNIRLFFDLFMPIIVGYLLNSYGFSFAFLLGSIFIFFSFIPLLKLKIPPVSFDWSPREVIAHIFDKRHHKYMFAEAINGFEGSFTTVLWPIVIFILLQGDFFSIGVIVSATTMFLIFANTITGQISDRVGQSKIVLRFVTVMHSFGWVLKALVETALEIFAVRSFSRVSGSLTDLSVRSISFGYTAKDKEQTDELLILREVSLSAGRLVGYVFMGAMSFFLPLQWLFLFAALAALALNLIPTK